MADATALDTEDRRKLHAEINQILNQRFLLTTAAITVFGVFSSWTIPKDLSHPATISGRLVFAGAAFLQLFLLVLFLWNRFLANLQSNLAIYLILRNASEWQSDWKRFHPKRGALSTGVIQTSVFLALGVLSFLWAFVISMACGLTLEAGWVLFEVIILVAYLFLVYAFGIWQWMRNDAATEERWREILATPDKTEASAN